MTRFRDAVHDLAAQAPPVGDVAERALDGARRKRRVLIPAMAAVMVALVAACVLVVGMLSGPGEAPKRDTAADPKLDMGLPIEFPDEADPLPAEGVGPALLTYSIACDEDDRSEFPPQCWRVVTTDGKHWALPDASASTHEDYEALDSPVVVSPDGDRLAYFRKDGSFVIRHLRSGVIDEVLQWRPPEIDFLTISWSASGRWLVVTPDGGVGVWGFEVPSPNAVLVDTDPMKTIAIDAYGRSFGVADSGSFPFGYETSLSARDIPRVDALPVIDHTGQRVGSVSAKLLPGRQRQIDGVTGSVSPDGQTLAAIGTDYSGREGDPNYGATALTLVDVANQRVAREYFYQEDQHTWLMQSILGWRDNSTLLMLRAERRPKANPDPDDVPYGETLGASVVSLNAETGEMQKLLRFAEHPNRLIVAQGLLGSGR